MGVRYPRVLRIVEGGKARVGPLLSVPVMEFTQPTGWKLRLALAMATGHFPIGAHPWHLTDVIHSHFTDEEAEVGRA